MTDNLIPVKIDEKYYVMLPRDDAIIALMEQNAKLREDNERLRGFYAD